MTKMDVRERGPWRPVAASVTALGTPTGIGVLHPILGEIVAIIELVVALTIIGTALFGSPDLSDRAFRLLRWIGNRPEPPAPGASGAGGGGPVTPGPPVTGTATAVSVIESGIRPQSSPDRVSGGLPTAQASLAQWQFALGWPTVAIMLSHTTPGRANSSPQPSRPAGTPS
jgi:hypothetical protein